ncbi:hypothetical protein KCU83_g173, partial [Aureobasidium melanogenum]
MTTFIFSYKFLEKKADSPSLMFSGEFLREYQRSSVHTSEFGLDDAEHLDRVIPCGFAYLLDRNALDVGNSISNIGDGAGLWQLRSHLTPRTAASVDANVKAHVYDVLHLLQRSCETVYASSFGQLVESLFENRFEVFCCCTRVQEQGVVDRSLDRIRRTLLRCQQLCHGGTRVNSYGSVTETSSFWDSSRSEPVTMSFLQPAPRARWTICDTSKNGITQVDANLQPLSIGRINALVFRLYGHGAEACSSDHYRIIQGTRIEIVELQVRVHMAETRQRATLP